MYILLASVEHGGGPKPDSLLWPRLQQFVRDFNPREVRYAGHEFRRLLEAIARGAHTSRNVRSSRPRDTIAYHLQPRPGITLIQQALLRLDPKTSTFGSLPLMFVNLCLLERNWEEAFPILDNDICGIAPGDSDQAERQNSPVCARHVPSSMFITQAAGFTTKVTSHELLCYYVYGAMLYLLGRRYDRALVLLQNAMTFEALSSASKIQVEAYKRWILANLLKEGRVPQFPRGANGQASKYMRGMNKPYEALGDAFKDADVHNLHKTINAGDKIWVEVSVTF